MLRDMTCLGYFSTEAGWKYIGYIGNLPNIWDGVPQEVMDRYYEGNLIEGHEESIAMF
nr:hypothetical protein [Algoriphagus resistens]